MSGSRRSVSTGIEAGPAGCAVLICLTQSLQTGLARHISRKLAEEIDLLQLREKPRARLAAGGALDFGPDGYLYVGMGDGGSGNDPEHRAQNPIELLGKMLRIDVNVPDTHPTGYQIPADNPFAPGHGPVPARPEIWAFGLRNPFRWSFDDTSRGGAGALVIGDVGQSSFEEIDYEPANRLLIDPVLPPELSPDDWPAPALPDRGCRLW